MNPALPYFRSLHTIELHAKLKQIRKHLADDDRLEEDLKLFAEGLLLHLISLSQSSFDYVDRMKDSIEKLPQSHQGKEFLLADLNDLLLSPPNIREKIKDRLKTGLVHKPPEPEKKKPKSSVAVGGRTFEFPEGLEP